MNSLLLALATLAPCSLAAARCVTADDPAICVALTRQDGRSGAALARGRRVLVTHTGNAKAFWQGGRRTTSGICDLTRASTRTDEYDVGGGPGGCFSPKCAGKPTVPKARKSWQTKVNVIQNQNVDIEPGLIKTRYTSDVTYSFQDLAAAKLSACTSTIPPVEARFTGNGGLSSRCWISCPDQDSGLETRHTDDFVGENRKLGQTALIAQG